MTTVAATNEVGAFFDMDKTLLSVSSATLWARHRVNAASCRWVISCGSSARWCAISSGSLDMAETTRRFVLELAGQSEDMHEAKTRRWVADQLVNYVAEEGRHWVKSHRRLGHRVALITASPWYTADPLARAFGMAPEDVLATRFEVENGQFTGRMLEPMLYGAGKLSAAAAYARHHGLNLAASFFYTDSISDLPLLENVGHPVAVNPDRSLRRLAETQGLVDRSFLLIGACCHKERTFLPRKVLSL